MLIIQVLGIIVFIILSYLKEEWAILIAVASFPFVGQFKILGLHATLPGLLLSVLFLVMIIKILLQKIELKRTPLDLPFGFFMLAVLISGLNAIDKKAYIVDTLHMIQFIAVYYLVVNSVKSTKFSKRIIYVFLLTMIFQSFYGMFQFIIQRGNSLIYEYVGNEYVGIIVRAAGTAQLQLPIFLNCAILFGIALFIYTRKIIGKSLLVLFLIFYFVALSFTLVRSGWVSCLFGILTVLFLAIKDKILFKKILIPAVLIGCIFILSFFISPLVKNRILFSFRRGTTAVGSIDARIKFWRESIKMFMKHPWTGVGFNNYSVHLPANLKYMEGQDPYNLFLRFLAETGIIGLLCWIFVLITLFHTCWKDFHNPISLGLAGIMAAWVLFSFYGTVLVGGSGDLYFFLMGLWINNNRE